MIAGLEARHNEWIKGGRSAKLGHCTGHRVRIINEVDVYKLRSLVEASTNNRSPEIKSTISVRLTLCDDIDTGKTLQESTETFEVTRWEENGREGPGWTFHTKQGHDLRGPSLTLYYSDPDGPGTAFILMDWGC